MIKALALALALTVSVQAHASLAKFSDAKTQFEAGRAPTAKELYNALWMTTSIASNPKTKGTTSGLFPNGAIKDGTQTYRQIAKFTPQANGTVITKVSYTDADYGTALGETSHDGKLTTQGLVLTSKGDSQSCATKAVCRVLATKQLLCAQANDDDRAVCTSSYKRGIVSAYVGYAPVHP